MYKTKFLFIFLALIVPLLCSKAIIGDEFVRETNVKRGKADPNYNVDNSEEVLDFWDFDPHSAKAPGKGKSGALPALKPNKAVKDTKAYGTKAEREKLKEIDSLLKEMEKMLSLMEKKAPKQQRLLQSEPVSLSSPSELETMSAENGEGGFNEEVILPGEEEEQEEQEEDNGNDGGDNTDVEENPEEVPEEYYTGAAAPGNILDDGMSTVKLYALIRYDMTLQQFANQGGQQYFINRVSDVLGVDEDIMRILSIRQGSVIIEFEFVLTGGKNISQEELERRIQDLGTKLNDAVASGSMNLFNGAPILNYEPQIIVYSNAPNKDTTSGSGYIIGLTIGLAFLTLAFITFFLLRSKRISEPQLLKNGRQQVYIPRLPDSQVNLDLEDKVNEPNEGSIEYEESESMKMYAASISPASGSNSGSGSGSGSDEDNKASRQEQNPIRRRENKKSFPKIQIA